MLIRQFGHVVAWVETAPSTTTTATSKELRIYFLQNFMYCTLLIGGELLHYLYYASSTGCRFSVIADEGCARIFKGLPSLL